MADHAGNDASSPSTPDAEAEAAWRRAAAAEKSAYNRFLEKLRHPSAKPLVHRMQTFVNEFAAGRPAEEASDEIHRFQDRAAAWMLSKAVVFAADADEEGSREAEEGLEKFLLCRLYPKVFAADLADQEADASLSKHVGGLSWVELRHLGIPPVQLALFPVAIQELRSIDEYRAPKDKLLCILNACNVINDILKATHEGVGDGKVRALSADDFLPLLIYLVIRANPSRLHSNAEFVAAFRHPSRMSGEDAYFATAFCSAKEFLRTCGPSEFEVTLEEYTIQYAAAVSRSEQAAASAPAAAPSVGATEAPPQAASHPAPSRQAGEPDQAPPASGAAGVGGAARSPPAWQTDAEEDSDDDSEERERLIFSVREAHVYQIPPASSAAGHKADQWQKAICKGPLRIAAQGTHLSIRLFDGSTGSLFAACEMTAGEHDKFVEPVTDSSRYFVLKITNGQRHAFIGVGFDDRNDSFDFKCALSDFKSREAAPVRRPACSQAPAKDLSLKDGEKITIKLKGVASQRSQGRAAAAPAAEGGFGIPVLPRPDGAQASSGPGAHASRDAPAAHVLTAGAGGPVGPRGRQNLMDFGPPDLVQLDGGGLQSPGGSPATDADADLFDDFVFAAPGQGLVTGSGGASSASSPTDFVKGGDAWDDFGGFQACAGQAGQPPPQPQRWLEPSHEAAHAEPEPQPQRWEPLEPAKPQAQQGLQQTSLDRLAAVDPLNKEPMAAAPPPPKPRSLREEGLGEPQGEVEDPFAEFGGIGMDHFSTKAVPCR